MTLLHDRPEFTENISFTFHTDAIAQEENERVLLELVPNPETTAPSRGEGIFFRNEITMTIVDSDGKILLLLYIMTLWLARLVYNFIILFYYYIKCSSSQ